MIRNKWQILGRSCTDRLVAEFGRVCDRRKLRGNVGKSKVISCSRNDDASRIGVLLKGELLEEVQGLSTWDRMWRKLNSWKPK